MKAKTLTSMLAILYAGTVHAQTAGSGQPAPAVPDQQIELTEIIVTAQRRSERQVDVPVSITVVTAEALELAGPTSLENLTKAVPGVYIQRAVYGLSPTIRGIGSTLASSGGEQNVATYIDGVYQASPTGNIFDLASVAGVEVLKGPQGTLFGRNATGGALLVRTLDPDFAQAGRFNISYERFDQIRASAYLNVPLTDKIAVNGAVAHRHARGYIRDNRTGDFVNEGSDFTARGKILYQPVDNLSIILAASHADFDDPTGSSYQSVGIANAYLLPTVDAGPIARDRYHLSHNVQPVIRTKGDEYSARATLDLDLGTISAISAYKTNSLFSTNDLDTTYATIPAPVTLPPPLPPLVVGSIPTDQSVSLRVETETFSQEINLASAEDGPFSYVAGLYYFYSEQAVPFLLSNGAPLFNTLGKTDAYAGYAEGTYAFGDLSLIAGLRYSYEERSVKTAPGVSAPSPFTRLQYATDKKTTPRVGVRYALSPRANVYATYSKGFKSGVFDATTPTGTAIKPETVNAYEVGFKTSSGRLTLDIAGFYYDYRDAQVNSTVSGESGAIFTQLINVPKSRIYGIDIDGTLRLSDAFDLRAAVAYVHSRYVDFKSAPGYSNDPANPGSALGLIFADIVVDASGNRMVRTPELTASATLGYHAEFGEDNRLDVTVSPSYSSRVHFDFANTLSQKAVLTLDAAATVTLANDTTITVYGRNLTDRVYYTMQSNNALGAAGTFAMPRTYGVSLGYRF